MTQHIPAMIEFIHDNQRETFVLDVNTTQLALLQNFAPDPESTPSGFTIYTGSLPTPPVQSAESMVRDIYEIGDVDDAPFQRALEMGRALDEVTKKAEPMTTTFELNFIWRWGGRDDLPQGFQFKAPEWERASLLTDEIERAGGVDMYDVTLDEASLHYPGLRDLKEFLEDVRLEISAEDFDQSFERLQHLTHELIRTTTPKPLLRP